MIYRLLLAIAFAFISRFVVADHTDTGVLRTFTPPTIGAPAENDELGFNETYNGLRLTILDGRDFRFDVGNAIWLGHQDIQVVDTPTEQSFFLNDSSLGFPLERNLGLETNSPGAGLLIGEIFSNGSNPFDAADAIRVEYRLTGSEEIRVGSTSATIFIPEPTSASMFACSIPLLALSRNRRRRFWERRVVD